MEFQRSRLYLSRRQDVSPLQIIAYVVLLGVSVFLLTWGILNVSKSCELPVAKASIGTGALTGAITFALVTASWMTSRLKLPRKDEQSEKGQTATLILVFVLWVVIILGTLASWGYLGYCALTMYIKRRRFPNVISCDAMLLDPVFYIAAVVITVAFLGLVAILVELGISWYFRSPVGASRSGSTGQALSGATEAHPLPKR